MSRVRGKQTDTDIDIINLLKAIFRLILPFMTSVS